MLEIVIGQTKTQTVAQQVIAALQAVDLDGVMYFGYPVLATADEKTEVDALLISKTHGLIGFVFAAETPLTTDIDGWRFVQEAEDRLAFALDASLARHEGLRRKRELGVRVEVATIFPGEVSVPDSFAGNAISISGLGAFVSTQPPVPGEFWDVLQAALQKVTTIKPIKKRASVSKAKSRGAILKAMEKEIANLDRWQKKAAIETPDGPQRIRGLAGSGKTIVLALKAAYLHALHPEWKIAVTFHSRALQQQFVDLIRRFCFAHMDDEPNWDNLQVITSWGGHGDPGVYSQIAQHAGLPVRNFLYAKTAFGMVEGFKQICSEVLSVTRDDSAKPLYDAILIDEAQDLPTEFFQLVYRFCAAPKRIIWAYDELQKLSEAAMPSTVDLFGKSADGRAKVNLENLNGRPRQDIILPVCYRNPPWTLSLAHALGFGTTRQKLIQHFDDPGIWLEIGYKLNSGELVAGKAVELERSPSSYPNYFNDLLDKADSVICAKFADESQQAEWIADSIQVNLTTDELEHDDILIVLPLALTAKREAHLIMSALARRGIVSHLVGVTSSRDEFFVKNSIALAHIHRSKGNEAPMVYVANVQNCDSAYELSTNRNILFTAITRARAWVRITGVSPPVDGLFQEIQRVVNEDFKLRFTVPTAHQLTEMRMIHRDRTADERSQIKTAEKGLEQFLTALRSGLVSPELLPPETRADLLKLLGTSSNEVDDVFEPD